MITGSVGSQKQLAQRESAFYLLKNKQADTGLSRWQSTKDLKERGAQRGAKGSEVQ